MRIFAEVEDTSCEFEDGRFKVFWKRGGNRVINTKGSCPDHLVAWEGTRVRRRSPWFRGFRVFGMEAEQRRWRYCSKENGGGSTAEHLRTYRKSRGQHTAHHQTRSLEADTASHSLSLFYSEKEMAKGEKVT